jgi:ribosomal protein L37E
MVVHDRYKYGTQLVMSKAKKEITEADCACCGKHHDFETPVKSFVCQQCGVGQSVASQKAIGYSRKRNYPEGFWA